MINLENIRNELFERGVVLINTGKERADLTVMKEILNLFDSTLAIDKYYTADDKRLQIVSETEMFGSEYLHWHTDQSHGIQKFNGTVLAYDGSDYPTYTEFADMKKAYQELSDDDKEYYSDVECIYGFPVAPHALMTREQRRLLLSCTPKTKQKQEPSWKLICTHPITGEKSLYFSPLTLKESSKPIDRDKLLAHCEQFSYKHHWKKGDILIWDNRLVIHRRPAFEGKRKLFRANIRYE